MSYSIYRQVSGRNWCDSSNCHAAAVARGEKPHHEHNDPYPQAAQVVGRSENLFPTTCTSNSPEKHAALIGLWITTRLSRRFLQNSSQPRVTSTKSWFPPTQNCFRAQVSCSCEIKALSTYGFSITTARHELIPPSSRAVFSPSASVGAALLRKRFILCAWEGGPLPCLIHWTTSLY